MSEQTLYLNASNAVLIIGASGTGKSTSLRNLKPEETFIFNCANKMLPFKTKGYSNATKDNPKGNVLNTYNADIIVKMIKKIDENRPEIKNIIIDDLQYIQAFSTFDRLDEGGYRKYSEMANMLNVILKALREIQRPDVFGFLFSHFEEVKTNIGSVDTRIKVKTVGKMVDDLISVEGLFSICLMTDIIRERNQPPQYTFVTQNEGNTICKSPMGMFELREPNDIALIREKILKFYLD